MYEAYTKHYFSQIITVIIYIVTKVYKYFLLKHVEVNIDLVMNQERENMKRCYKLSIKKENTHKV